MTRVNDAGLVKEYCRLVTFSSAEKLVFCLAALSMGLWGLGLSYSGGELPPWLLVTALPVVLWVAIALPRHFRALRTSPDLVVLRNRPFLSTKCTLASLEIVGSEGRGRSRLGLLMAVSYIAGIGMFMFGLLRLMGLQR